VFLCDWSKLVALLLVLVAASTALATDSGAATFHVVAEDAGSLTVEFALPDLRPLALDNDRATLTFEGATHPCECDPRDTARRNATVPLPVASTVVGLPPDASPTLTVLSETSETLNRSAFPELAVSSDGRIYSQTTDSPVANVTVMGYARDRYLARLELRPVRWNGRAFVVTRRCRVRIAFHVPNAAPPLGARSTPVSEPFEAMFRATLLNAEQAKSWHQTRPAMVAAPSRATQESPPRVRIRLSKTGLYGITPDDLRRLGFAPETIDPKTFRLTYRDDELAVDIIGGDDSVFDGNDRIIFYGEELRADRFTRSNAYMLTWRDREGRRPTIKDATPRTVGAQSPLAFRDVEHFELDRIHDDLPDVTGDRVDHYFWTGFTGTVGNPAKSVKRFEFNLPTEANFIPRDALMRIAFQGAGNDSPGQDHRMLVWIGGKVAGEARWEGQTARFVEIPFAQDLVASQMAINLECADRNGTLDAPNVNDVLLDWIQIDYWRQLRALPGGVRITPRVFPDLRAGPVQYAVDGLVTERALVYQLDETGFVSRMDNGQVTRSGDGFRVLFEDVYSIPTSYVVGTLDDLKRPEAIELAPSSGLLSPGNSADYVIISHADFLKAIQPLADYRASKGLEVKIIPVEDIYNDFNHGIFTPFAIQSFLRYAYQVWSKPPSYVLLVGDATYDYKDAEGAYYRDIGQAVTLYPNFVPTIHSWSIPWGETSMDHRFVTIVGDDPLPDMFIGRFPVQRASEVTEIVEKTIAYESNPETGPWQARIVQIADDEKTNAGDRIFQDSREELIRTLIPPEYEVQRIYLKVIGSAPRTKETIKNAIRDGALIVEYSGHGGRGNWTDEDILRYSDLSTITNGRHQPVVVATTCEMNFFDKPERFGDRSLGEEFIIGRNRGAAATIGATRLTFAVCNKEFDGYLFPQILHSPNTEVGLILAQAKITNISEYAAIQCLTGLEQYTLFGDPALRLARPPLRAGVELDSVALNPGQKIRIRQNSIIDPRTGRKATDFNGQLTVAVTYQNNLDLNLANDIPVQQGVRPVVGGEFGDIEFTVPATAIPGEGTVRVYAQSVNTTAIGGQAFSVRESRILSIVHAPERPSLSDRELSVTVELANPDGVAGIASVQLQWWSTTDFKTRLETMKSVGNLRYANAATLNLPGPGGRLRYNVIVNDTSGRTITSEPVTVSMPIGPDLVVAEIGRTGFPDLSYGFDRALNRWAFHVVVANAGDLRPTRPFEVVIVEGQADSNGDGILDATANVLTRGDVPVAAWKSAAAGTSYFEQATVSLILKEPLLSGIHDITVWVDPETPEDDHNDGFYGRISEPVDKEVIQNRVTKPFEINDFVVGTTDVLAYSLDRTLHMTVPAAASEKTSLSIQLESLPNAEALNNANAPYYRAVLPRLTNRAETAFRVTLQNGQAQFLKPVTLEIGFDSEAIRSRIVKDKQLPEFEENRTVEQRATLAEEYARSLSRLGIYRWLEDRKAWRRVESSIVRNDSNEVQTTLHITPTLPNAARARNLRIQELRVDAKTTPSGQWAILFVNAREYIVLFKPQGSTAYQELRERGRIEEPYEDTSVALRKLVVSNTDFANAARTPTPPEIGDCITFETLIDADGNVVGTNVRDSNAGDGTATINLRPNVNKQNASYGDWIVFVTSPLTYEIRNADGQLAHYSPGQFIDNGLVGRLFVVTALGLDFQILEGSRPYRFGDTFRVRVSQVPTVTSTIRDTGIYTLLEDRDGKPPTTQLFVNDQKPINGSVIPPRPTITLLLSDQNGVDPDTFSLELRKLGQTGFARVPVGEYTLNPNPINAVSVRYRPILYIGTYVFRIRFRDLAGTAATSDDNEYVDYVFSVDEDPDLIAPTWQVFTDRGIVNDGDTLDFSPKQFALNMRDEHALDVSTIRVALAPRGQSPTPLTADDYLLEFDRLSPSSGRILLPADLPNGDYDLYAEVQDTSTNVGTLGKSTEIPFRFTIREPVRLIGRVLPAPNPIRDETWFTYTLNQAASNVSVRIYSVAGRLVRVVDVASAKRGYNETYWDARDSDGKRLANGVYYYRIRIESDFEREEQTGKLAILR
jgi:hypothetical protein